MLSNTFLILNSQLLILNQKRKDCIQRYSPSFSTWRWRGSNPRPNEESICFLHAYSSLWFSSVGKTWTTNQHLSLKISCRHPDSNDTIPDILRLADPIASGRGLGETSCRSRLDRDKANLLYFG